MADAMFISRRLIRSRAWLDLKGAAQSVYLLLRLRCKVAKVPTPGTPKKYWPYEITNNGEIVFPYKIARKQYGIHSHRFAYALDQLLTNGLIDIAASGHGIRKQTTLYAISERWKNYGKPGFEIVERKKGYNPGFRKNNKTWQASKKTPNAADSTDTSAAGSTERTILALRTDQNGKTRKIRYNFRNDKWLQAKIA